MISSSQKMVKNSKTFVKCRRARGKISRQIEVSQINKKVRELKVCQNIVKLVKVERHSGVKKTEVTRQRPAGATSTGDGEPLPGAEKKEATARQRPAGATSTGDGEPLPWAEKKEATTKAGGGNIPGGRGKVEDGEALPKPKFRNRGHQAKNPNPSGLNLTHKGIQGTSSVPYGCPR